jgi:hypothetical protein
MALPERQVPLHTQEILPPEMSTAVLYFLDEQLQLSVPQAEF